MAPASRTLNRLASRRSAPDRSASLKSARKRLARLRHAFTNRAFHQQLFTIPASVRSAVDALLTQVYDKDWQWRSMGEPNFGGWKPVEARDLEPGGVVEGRSWTAKAYRVRHGDGVVLPPAFLQRWICCGYRFEAEGKVVAIRGDTVDGDRLAQLAQGAVASAEMENERFHRVAQYTLAAADTVGKIAARAKAKTLVLTHHHARRDDRYLKVLTAKWLWTSAAKLSWARI
jgi:hypothetical protein